MSILLDLFHSMLLQKIMTRSRIHFDNTVFQNWLAVQSLHYLALFLYFWSRITRYHKNIMSDVWHSNIIFKTFLQHPILCHRSFTSSILTFWQNQRKLRTTFKCVFDCLIVVKIRWSPSALLHLQMCPSTTIFWCVVVQYDHISLCNNVAKPVFF